jgi:serine/threonine-protein kinase
MPNVTEELRTALADRYVIESELGEGGMATVYLAHDVKHDRKVALKVLRPELAAVIGADRFLAEIKITANLQHPHILPLHDSGEVNGFLYYIMPYVEGESLRERLEREKQLPVDAAVAIVVEVADALDYAHRHDVIHRDIKPENILLHDGRALVADFGIALAVTSAGDTRLTETGISLGTPHYMSPEQAMGQRELTAACDVYALGALLYELLAGEPPFTGPTAQAIVARVVTETPRPLAAQRRTIPPNVEAATIKALEKLPADRFDTAAHFAEALVTPGFTSYTTQSGVATGPASPVNRRTILALAGVAAFMTMLFVGSLIIRPSIDAPRVTRHRVTLFADEEESAILFKTAFAPDGSAIVFSDTAGGTRRLWIKDHNQATATPLAGTDGGSSPFFSPDGQWIGFFADDKLKKIPRRGGSAITLTDSAFGYPPLFGGGAWLGDGTIVFNHRWGLYRIAESTGESEELLPNPDVAGGGRAIVGVQLIPGDRGVFFTGCSAICSESEAYVFDFAAGEARQIVEEASVAWYTPSGHAVYARRDGAMFAIPFDPQALAVTGAAVPVLSDVRTTSLGFPEAVLGADGTLLYVSGTSVNLEKTEPVYVDRTGQAALVDSGWIVRLSLGIRTDGIALSPDNTKLAIVVTDETSDLWIKELDRGPLTRLTFEGEINTRAVWTPDSRWIRFISDRSGRYRVWTKPADGSTPAVEFDGLPDPVWELIQSPSGELAAIRVGSGASNRDLLLVRQGDSTTVSLLSGEFDEFGAALSPDGTLMAYVSDESGRNEVYVRPFPDAGASRWQLSKSGGQEPLWAHSGREIFYVNDDAVMVASQVTTTPTFRIDGEVVLFDLGQDYRRDRWYRTYDVTPDDERFVMLRIIESDGQASKGDLILVENWFTELEQIVGGQ